MLRTLVQSCLVLSLGAATLGAVAAPAAAAEDHSGLRINEVQSDPNPDWIELTNVGEATVDLSGVVVMDEDPRTDALPPGTSIEPGEFLVLHGDVDFGFGLGRGDSVRLFAPGGEELIDAYAWTSHAATDGRCPDGVGEFVEGLEPTPGGPNACGIRINEIESNGDVRDWVEITNNGDEAVDVSGWIVKDDDDGRTLAFPAGSILEPGGYLTIDTDDPTVPGNFGLGTPDSARLFLPDGTTLVDAHSWGAHAPTTLGRCPDGTGPFEVTTSSTKGAANNCASPLRINEVVTDGDGPDWVEVANPTSTALDASGLVVRDATDTVGVVVPDGTEIAAGGHLAVDVQDVPGGFDLGAADTVRLLEADGETPIDSHTWSAHAETSYGRCPDGTGDFTTTLEPTKGAVNACEGILNPSAWPGGAAAGTVDEPGYFGSDMSGLSFEAGDPDVLWAVRNGDGMIFRLVEDDGRWVPDTADGWSDGKRLGYPEGGGTLDAEGVEMVDGAAYVATERDQTGSSRPSITRHEVAGAAAAPLDATHEWNLAADLPGIGANLGLEGIAFVPNDFLVEQGFHDERLDALYDPGNYPDQHGDGLFLVVVEDPSTAGTVFAYSLDEDGGFAQVASITNDLGAAMELEFEPDTGRLWVICDDGCNGRTLTAEIGDDGRFAGTAIHERPADLPNLNHEGFAIAPDSHCVEGRKPVFWSDDNFTDGQALWAGTLDCEVDDEPGEPVDPPKPPVVTPPAPSPVVAKSTPRLRVIGAKRPRIKRSGTPRQRTVRVRVAGQRLPALRKRMFTVRLKGTQRKVAYKVNRRGQLVIRLPKRIKLGNRALVVVLRATPSTRRVKQQITLRVRR